MPHAAIGKQEAKALRLEGSTTLLPAMQRLARAYERAHPGTEFDVRGSGSGNGIQALLQSTADIATSSRFLLPGELAAANERGVYPVPFQIAYDAIIPVVHNSNELRNLSLEELGQVFRAEIINWRILGGPDREIRLVLRGPDSGTYRVWEERVAEQPLPDARISRVESSSAVVKEVGSHPGAIGYIGLAGLNAAIKPLRVDGVIGSMGNVRSGRYALARPLFLFTNGWPEGVQLDFINFVLDPDGGQRVIEEAGLLPLYPSDRR